MKAVDDLILARLIKLKNVGVLMMDLNYSDRTLKSISVTEEEGRYFLRMDVDETAFIYELTFSAGTTEVLMIERTN